MRTDAEILDDFFEATAPLIEDVLSRAPNEGRRVGRLVIVLEQRFDGRVTATAAPRNTWPNFSNDPCIGADLRKTIVHAVTVAHGDDIPVVVFVHGEGYISVGVRRVRGKIVAVS